MTVDGKEAFRSTTGGSAGHDGRQVQAVPFLKRPLTQPVIRARRLRVAVRAQDARREPVPLTVYTIIVYTRHGMGEIGGFDWDAANVGHILRHEV